MGTQLRASPESVIEKWIDDNVEADGWPDCYLGGQIGILMTEAAAAVFDAVAEFQSYAKTEGLLMTDLLLPQGLLWFDDDPSRTLDDKVRGAAARYQRKYGKQATVCYVHPSAFPLPPGLPPGASVAAAQMMVGDVEVRAGHAILPNDFLIGRTASAEQEQLAEVREHVKVQRWQEADYDAHHVL